MLETFELRPTNGRASFYWKAIINKYTSEDKKKTTSELTSYRALVAKYHHEENRMELFGYYSASTTSHTNAFLDLYWFDNVTKKQIQNRKS